MRLKRSHIVASLLLSLYLPFASASPWAEPGDVQLRSDLQVLNDEGVINLPLTAWPLSWGDISRNVRSAVTQQEHPSYVWMALDRVNRRLSQESRGRRIKGEVSLSHADQGLLIRTFEEMPREENEARFSMDWMGRRFAAKLQVTEVSDPADNKDTRLDGSYLGMSLGNWMLSAGSQERWWGPGWDGSLILSTNARPVPALTLQRNNAFAPKTAWLNWLGPWQFTTFLGQMEGERHIPHALLWGARLNFKPMPSLEVGLSRTAQWGGDGRPEDLDAFWNMLIGQDNGPTDGHTSKEEEPGNQLAGYDLRWSNHNQVFPFALYGQLIGEDESQGLPTAMMRLLGVEHWGGGNTGSYRVSLEFADTATYRQTVGYNTAYNHHLYQSGYRYFGRSMGHSMDNDGQLWSLGGHYAVFKGIKIDAKILSADLNRDDAGINTVSTTAQRLREMSLSAEFPIRQHKLKIGVGWSELDEINSTQSDEERSAFIQWRSQL